MILERFLTNLWYKPKKRLAWVLLPMAGVYAGLSYLRYRYLTHFKQWISPVPVIVIGNISVGGVGKTPLVIAIAQYCQQQGLRVGIVSRGYRARCRSFPHEVKPSDLASLVGDESLLLVRAANCPVVIAPKRVEAVKYLLTHHTVDIILSDDGLQHYAMGRRVEIAVIDGSRGLGNGLMLPAGPLREGKRRLSSVDLCIVNEGTWRGAYPMVCIPTHLRCLKTGKLVSLDILKTQAFIAMAGIGSPQRFFNTLKKLKCEFKPIVFPDHYAFTAEDFKAMANPIVMTEKDAVKCEAFVKEGWYSLGIEAKVTQDFWQRFDEMVAIKRNS